MRKIVSAAILAVFLVLAAACPVFAQKESPEGPPSSPNGAAGNSSVDTPVEPPEDIHGLKALESPLGMSFKTKLLLIAAISAAFFLVLFAVYRHYARKRRLRQASPPPISPEEAARKALAEIRDLMDTDGKMFYFGLSLALREYIGRKFCINAPEMTSEELVPALRSLRLDDDLASEARRFFDYSDPVKFAGAIPERVKMERHYKFVGHFVKKTSETDTDSGQIPSAEERRDEKPNSEKQSETD